MYCPRHPLLGHGPLDLGRDVQQQRAIFLEMMQATPVPEDVTATPGELGGVQVVHIDVSSGDPATVIFYLNGGAYAIGSAGSSVPMASDLARRAGIRAISADYRLAPESPYPAALEDAVAAYAGLQRAGTTSTWVAIAGESPGQALRPRH